MSKHHTKQSMWASEYPVQHVSQSDLAVPIKGPLATARVAHRWRVDAEQGYFPSQTPAPESIPSPAKLRAREAELAMANDLMAREVHSHAHAGLTPAHSCVLAITEDRARRMSAEVDAQRQRLDAPYAFGKRAT